MVKFTVVITALNIVHVMKNLLFYRVRVTLTLLGRFDISTSIASLIEVM
jgi:hypothetical protein